MPEAPHGSVPAALLVFSPSGDRSQVPVHPVPFRIGRLSDNHLALRDNRISRRHAQIVLEDGQYVIEDCRSRYGVFVNGLRVERARLRHGDRISFGFEDSYQLTFLSGAGGVRTLLAQRELGSELDRLRATLEVARALQASLSTDEVLAAVVEAALAITGCERGFLLLVAGGKLEVRVARDRVGSRPPGEPRVPPARLQQVLLERRDLFSIPPEAVAGAVAIPLVRIRTGGAQQTSVVSAVEDTVGLLYMESDAACQLPAGSRELLTTLAMEASTVLENARLLEQQWERQRMEEELRIARRIQESLLPGALPSGGWLRAAGASVPSRQVGGDYYDLRALDPDRWAVAVADVSGKGVGAALLAALLQGMFLTAPYTRLPMPELLARVNRFLLERTGGEQYATVFYGLLESGGRFQFVNAGHPPALLLRRGAMRRLAAGAVPLGLLEEAEYASEETQLEPGDRLLIYTDGLTEARSAAGEFFGRQRLEQVAAQCGEADAAQTCRLLLEAVQRFTAGAEPADDIAVLVLEYAPPGS